MDRNELRGVLLLLAKIDEADGREDLDNEVAEAWGDCLPMHVMRYHLARTFSLKT